MEEEKWAQVLGGKVLGDKGEEVTMDTSKYWSERRLR